jgi:hypothetical protein
VSKNGKDKSNGLDLGGGDGSSIRKAGFRVKAFTLIELLVVIAIQEMAGQKCFESAHNGWFQLCQ